MRPHADKQGAAEERRNPPRRVNRRERFAWNLAIEAFLLMALWPIWSARFPPMQDYPQHLAEAYMLREHNNPALDFNRYYEFHLRPDYSAFFVTTLGFSTFLPIEAAGKLSLSLYPLLIAAVLWRLGRRREDRRPPWGALVLFPFAFNQQYFMGNINYLFSLPLLILALLDYEDLLQDPAKAWPVARHFLWQVVLFLVHPFTFLAYWAFAACGGLLGWRKRRKCGRRALIAMGGALVLAGAAALANALSAAPAIKGIRFVAWLTPGASARFFALMFTGMRWTNGACAVSIILWGALFAVAAGAWVAARKERASAFAGAHAVYLGVAVAALFALPVVLNGYTFLNCRVAAIVYFLMALLIAEVRFGKWWREVLVVLLCLCMVDSLAQQARISAEVQEVLPVISKIPPNSRILPLVFDRGSPELERGPFDIHLHDHNYYHVLIGGGFDPYLPSAPLNPVRYRPGEMQAAPSEYVPGDFSWTADAADYQYFLLRGAPPEFLSYMKQHCKETAASGEWKLFKRKAAGNQPG